MTNSVVSTCGAFGDPSHTKVRRRAKMKDSYKLAPFNPSSQHVMESCLELAEIRSSDVVYDLGCGDARVLEHLSRTTGCRGVGIEYDSKFYDRAVERVKEVGLMHLIELRYGDACKVPDLDSATVIFCYLSAQGSEELNEKLQRAHEAGTRIISNMFQLKHLGQPSKAALCDGITKLYLYHEDTDPVAWLRRVLDPLQNWVVMPIFNVAMVAMLGLARWATAHLEHAWLHFAVMSTLSTALIALVNYYVFLLRQGKRESKLVEIVKKDQ